MSKLKRNSWLLTSLIAIAAVALFGCDDGGGSETGNDTSGTDMAGGDTATGDTNTGSDTNTNGDTGGTDTSMAEEVPITWPASPDEFVSTSSSVTYVATLEIPALDANDVPECCRDFGEISRDYVEAVADGLEPTNEIDNALAGLADSIQGIAPDFSLQDTLDEQIMSGSLALLFDHREFNGMATDDDNFVLVGLLGSFADPTTYAEASAGTGTFNINPASFVSGGEPLIKFNPAIMASGEMSAGPSTFQLTFPLGFANLDVAVSDTLIAGTASVEANGVSYTSGTLSGYVEIEELIAAINALMASPDCECLGLGDTPLYEYDASTGEITDNCVDQNTANTECETMDEEICRTLGGGTVEGVPIPLCGALPGFVTAVADIDVDGDCATDPEGCAFEALSLGLRWTGVPGTIEGLEMSMP